MRQLKQKAVVYLSALLLLVYPLRHAWTGLDIMDAGYSLGNYQYFDSLNKTWKFATYLSNIVGRLLSWLPFGNTWVGMNFYTSLLIGITAAVVYLFFVRLCVQAQGAWWEKHILFLAEFTAVSLCWAPSVILYHYLGYFFITAAALLLYQAITKDKENYYIIAGVILGLCVAVRMPNITYMALILPVWYSCFQTDANTRWQRLIRRTIRCIAGYFVGFLVPIIYISIRYGFATYPEMVQGLFAMTDTATDYKPDSMVTAMFADYIENSVWLFLFLAYMAAGFAAFALLTKIFEQKSQSTGNQRLPDFGRNRIAKVLYLTAYGLYIIGLLVLVRLCYGRGMFDFDYTEYFSMYKWAVVYLLIVNALCIWCLMCRQIGEKLKLWAVFLLVIIWITPLGSNNGLYPIINNLFLTAPVSALMLTAVFRQFKGVAHAFVFRWGIGVLLAGMVLQSLLFGIFFVFHDKQPIGMAAEEQRQTVYLQSSDKVNGLKTTTEKKELLEALDQFLVENNLTKKKLILYGDIPALAYIFNMESAVFTTWPDLYSNPLTRLQQDLDNISNEKNDELPVVIFGTQAVNKLKQQSGIRYQKFSVIWEFMQKKQYKAVYQSKQYQVFYPPSLLHGCFGK